MNEFVVKFSTGFRAIRILENTLFPTNWKVTFDLIAEELDGDDFTFAIAKINFWFDELIDNSIILQAAGDWIIDIHKISNHPVLCPFEPHDNHLTTLFVCKINALADGIFTTSSLELESDTGGPLTFTYVGDNLPLLPPMEEWIGKRSFFKEPWWHRNDGSTLDIIPKKDDNLSDIPPFAFDFDFLRENAKEKETQEAEIIYPKKFKPKIIKGNGGDKQD